MSSRLCNYVEELYSAVGFEEAFLVLEKEVLHLGFDGVLYTYIPKPLVCSRFDIKPVYKVSREYPTLFLEHYTEARYDLNDPLIAAVTAGVKDPITWWGSICKSYRNTDVKSDEVILTARHYGIGNGVTIPLMSNAHGISGASIISEDEHRFDALLEQRLPQLTRRIQLFHHLVLANKTVYLGTFFRPLLTLLSSTEIGFVKGLAEGKSPPRIASELNRSEKYLDQVMRNVRRKVSGGNVGESPVLNRNQLMYYAGLLNILEYENMWDEAD